MIEVIKSGLLDTIQDQGRFGVQQYGVPISGVMDTSAALRANQILGNQSLDAVLEMTILGPKLKFQCNTQFSISGANLSPKLNDVPISNDQLQIARQNDILSFGARQSGCRAYLAVKNGFQTEIVMGSRSMYRELTSAVKLKKGDLLPIVEFNSDPIVPNITSPDIQDMFQNDSFYIEVYKGMEYYNLTQSELDRLLSTEFTISKDSNRMAYQVEEHIENNLKPIITSLVLPGTVQLTPSGKLLILMRDCQTTGGYPRIFQISEASINYLSQKFSGDKIRFKCIDS